MTSCFNSRAHGGRDTRPKTCIVRQSAFQFTRPRGARHPRAFWLCVRGLVSIHAPTGGATSITGYLKRRLEFQFTRPRGARLKNEDAFRTFVKFQFTRPRGARRFAASRMSEALRFQFTRPRGARPAPHKSARRPLVSIHAPTGGATRAKTHHGPSCVFQFTRPRGARLLADGEPVIGLAFQFTRPRGARPLAQIKARLLEVSIHAPTGGATAILKHGVLLCGSFNSRAHGGRDLRALPHHHHPQVSIHAPTGGATRDREGF